MTATEASRSTSLIPGASVVNGLPREQWRNYVVQHPDGNIFHMPEMFEVFARTKHHEPQVWAVVDDVGQVQALFTPVIVTLAGGALRRHTTRAVAYGSVLAEPTPTGRQALRLLLREYRRAAGRRALFTELRNLTDIGSAQSTLTEEGFAYEPHLNYIIDLDLPADRVLQNMGGRTRKQIRSGVRKGDVVVEEVREQDGLEEFYRILRVTYSRARVPLAHRSLFEAALDVLEPAGLAKLWLARYEGTAIAASAELVFKETLYGWYGGVDRAFSSHQPGELLMWHILSWGVSHGMTQYDFGGAGKPDEKYGVRAFKAKFGGDLVCFGRNTCIHAPTLLRMSSFGYRQYRRLHRV